jgi:CBS domain-containing protein
MIEHDCGEIPVVYGAGTMRPIDVITDRDITCRTIAQGKNPLGTSVGDGMSTPCVILPVEVSLEDCCRAMVASLVRRIPVVDESGRCCGIVSQADIARTAGKPDPAEVVKHLSQPKAATSLIT